MDKSAELKSIAKGLAAGGILGAGAGIAASDQIRKNKHNARTVKGWDTRRRNAMTKKAENSDTLGEVKMAVRALGKNLDHPTYAAADYAKRSLLSKVRKMITAKVVRMKKPGGYNA